MRYISRYLFPFSTFLLALLIYRYLTYPYNVRPGDLRQIYQPGDAATPENYSSQCKQEFDKNLIFPLGRVSKAVLCKGFFSLDKTLSDSCTHRILEILNDTSSYVWGEVGTFLPGRRIVFYDSEGNVIGVTELEEENGSQTYSYPYLRRMKWGALTDKAFTELEKLITNQVV